MLRDTCALRRSLHCVVYPQSTTPGARDALQPDRARPSRFVVLVALHARAGSPGVILWDARSRRQINTLRYHVSDVVHLAFGGVYEQQQPQQQQQYGSGPDGGGGDVSGSARRRHVPLLLSYDARGLACVWDVWGGGLLHAVEGVRGAALVGSVLVLLQVGVGRVGEMCCGVLKGVRVQGPSGRCRRESHAAAALREHQCSVYMFRSVALYPFSAPTSQRYPCWYSTRASALPFPQDEAFIRLDLQHLVDARAAARAAAAKAAAAKAGQQHGGAGASGHEGQQQQQPNPAELETLVALAPPSQRVRAFAVGEAGDGAPGVAGVQEQQAGAGEGAGGLSGADAGCERGLVVVAVTDTQELLVFSQPTAHAARGAG